MIAISYLVAEICLHVYHMCIRNDPTFPYIGIYQLVKVRSRPISLNNPLPQNPDFQRPLKRSLLKTIWEKEKMLVTSIFSFSHNVFFQFQKEFLFLSHIYFVVCKCFQFGPVKKLVLW